LAKDTLRDNDRFCPVSIDSMNPHEHEINPADKNCRIQFAAVDLGGAWTCGQWEQTDMDTKINYRLLFSLDETGRGMWWTRYYEYCYNF